MCLVRQSGSPPAGGAGQAGSAGAIKGSTVVQTLEGTSFFRRRDGAN